MQVSGTVRDAILTTGGFLVEPSFPPLLEAVLILGLGVMVMVVVAILSSWISEFEGSVFELISRGPSRGEFGCCFVLVFFFLRCSVFFFFFFFFFFFLFFFF